MSTKKRFVITLLAIVLLLGAATATPAITIVVYATDAAGTGSSGSSGSGSSGGGGGTSMSTTAQMAANSQAWNVAHDAGDTATCNALHAANVALANSAASGGGSATFNSQSGTWSITDSRGNTTTSSSSGTNGSHGQTINYTTTTSSGQTTTMSAQVYNAQSVEAYLNNGGTVDGLKEAYNARSTFTVVSNAKVQQEHKQTYAEGLTAADSAKNEVDVVKTLLGLSESQASDLQSQLENAKQGYYDAKKTYENSEKEYGNYLKLKQATEEANKVAEEIREQYGYTGNKTDKTELLDNWQYKFNDGSFFEMLEQEPESYTIGGSPSGGGGGGTPVDDVKLYTITASAEGGCSITPAGTIYAAEGSSKTFTIAPASSDYVIKTIYIDGEPISPQTTHTFGNITAPHTIRAVGAPAMTLEIGDIDLKDPSGKDLTAKDSYIRSGYGLEANCDLTLTGATVTKAYATMANGDVCQMEMVGSKLQFVVNKASKVGARRYYIPVETKDGDFEVTIHVEVTSDVDATKTLTQDKTMTVTINGTMYDDDFTGDRTGRV